MRNSRRFRSAWLILVLLLPTVSLSAAEGVLLELVPASEALFDPVGEGECPAPSSGELLVVGRFSTEGFSIRDIGRIALQAPDGRTLPLLIEEESLSGEFGEIQSLRFLFAFPEKEAADALFRLVWGPDVSAENRLVRRIFLDPAAAGRVREFRRCAEPAAPPGEQASLATIAVRAESYADLYALWYLVPIGLVFVLLIARKMYAHERTS
ncbi:MAG: hypothetical protein V1918_09545 [Planctomycetota bacterium]